MKIMLVNDCPVGLPGSGGVEGHIIQLDAALRDAGHTCIVLTHQFRGEPEVHTGNRYLLPALNTPPLRKRFLHNAYQHRKALQRVTAIVDAENPDVIHVHNMMNPGTLNLLKSLRPTVKSIHDCRPFCAKPYPVVASRLIGQTQEFCDITFGPACWKRCYQHAGDSLMERIEAWSYFPSNYMALQRIKEYDRIIVYSEYLQLLAEACHVDVTKIDMLYHFTDIEKMTLPDKQERTPPRIVYAGRLSPEKGIQHMLCALEQIKDHDFDVVIAGQGPMEADIRNWLTTHNLEERVQLRGHLSHEEMIKLYQEAAIVIFPSIGSEGCPLTGIEAMYCQTPVVGFNVGGVPEWLVSAETGILLQRGDIDAMADGIGALLKDPRLRKRLGEQAHKYVSRKFTLVRHIDGLLDSYTQAIEARRESAANGASL